MERNGFPGSPLFCQFEESYGLVGLLSNHNSGNDIGNKIKFYILWFRVIFKIKEVVAISSSFDNHELYYKCKH